ncbi:MAG TPA: MXAN_6577-like cysteine-rich protein, partial [Nannocystis sp.]
MSRRLAPVLSCVLACNAGGAVEETGSSGSTGESTGGATDMDSTASTPTTGSGCAAPLGACEGVCVDLDHDPEHCGDCGVVCEVGLTCVEGSCEVACGSGGLVCGEQCVAPDSDPAHCGGCDRPCGEGVACIDGQCAPVCGPDETLCGEQCVALARDEAHCGGCDLACAGDQPCVFGHCVDVAVHHLLIGGQSLSVGYGSQVLSVEQPFDNLSFNTGVRAGAEGLTSFVPLVEAMQGNLGETIASGLANHVAEQQPIV